ncbi:MAG: hypothetical protein WBN65_06700, partial [Gammaproteobacteria bacterium]
MLSPFTTFRAGIWLTLLASLVLPGCATTDRATTPAAPTQEAVIHTAPKAAYIVQYRSAAEAAEVVRDAGGEITHELTVIRAVGAELDETQVAQLRESHHGLRVFADHAVSLDALTSTSLTQAPADVEQRKNQYQDPVGDAPHQIIGADRLHDNWIDGWGVGVAVLDTPADARVGPASNYWRSVWH